MPGSGTGTPITSPSVTLQNVIDMIRLRLNNYEKPYYWTDTELVYYVNEIVNRMCREARVIEDSTNITSCEIILDSGTADEALHASVIFVKAAQLVTKELLTLDVAPATTWAIGDTITGVSSGATSTVLEALTSKTYVIEGRSLAYSKDEVLTNGTVTADQGTSYPTIKYYEAKNLIKTSLLEVEEMYPSWRKESGEPTHYLLDATDGYITLYPNPDAHYTLRLTVYRYPIAKLIATGLSGQAPEVDEKYYDMIVDGVCGMAYMKRGENTFNTQSAMIFMGLFQKAISNIKIKNAMYRGGRDIAAPSRGFM